MFKFDVRTVPDKAIWLEMNDQATSVVGKFIVLIGRVGCLLV